MEKFDFVLILIDARWHGKNFLDSSRNVRLEGSVLHADLKSSENTWITSCIDLDVVIGNDNGQLVNGKCRR